MTPVTFENAPLVEIIAELRWIPPNLSLGGGLADGVFQLPVSMFGANKAEEFFMRFGGAAYQQGFQRSERLVPPGFPLQLGQPVYRYKPVETSPDDLMRSALLQVGPGIFSANAIPPYKSWTEFSPIVARGVEALLGTRDATESQLPFTGVGLRYIDAFGPGLRTKFSPSQFIREILGFGISLPGAVLAQTEQPDAATSQLQFVIPVHGGMTMSLAIGEGLFNSEAAVIMDTTVAVNGEVEGDLNAIMIVLNDAREMIHAMFVDLTEKIRSEMNPVAEA